MYKLGLVSISFRQNNIDEILSAMKDCGLSCVEWGSDVHAPKNDVNKLEEIVLLQKKYGIICSSYGTYFRLGVTPICELEDYIIAAKILGTDILRLWCGDKNSEEYDDCDKKALFNACKTAAKLAEKHGVKLCMECHNGTYTNRCAAALELVNEINSPAFCMYWQPNQYRTFEENLEYAEKISKYTEILHVFNWKADNRFPLEEAIDVWQKYLSKFGGDKTLLLEFMPDDSIESLANETIALRKIAGE